MRDADGLAPERSDDVEVLHVPVEDLEELDGELLLAIVHDTAEVPDDRLGRVVGRGGHGEDAVHRHLVGNRGPREFQCNWRGAIHADFDSDSRLLCPVFRKPRRRPAARHDAAARTSQLALELDRTLPELGAKPAAVAAAVTIAGARTRPATVAAAVTVAGA